MNQPLATKIFIPPDLPKQVPRSRLLKSLDESRTRKVFLLSAPAGFGKTTLVSDWVRTRNISAAWVSLDEGDNDLRRFIHYLVFSLRTIFPKIGDQFLQISESPQMPQVDVVITSLINEIAFIEDDFFLIFDDYHVIEDNNIDSALTFLVENMPPQMHLIMTTREDPQLPLARLRARNQLSELRVSDLRFNHAEVKEFLNELMNLKMPDTELSALESKTEGWIAGLQLAAISLQKQENKTEFVKSFTGSHQFIMDFLVEEVLNHQSEKITEFLLKSSILDRMNGSLCDAVISDPLISSQEILEYLYRSNLFIIPLDNERRWYRFHQLFSDLLRQRLLSNTGGSRAKDIKNIADLHIRASQWFEDHGFVIEAFNHAAAANDIPRAERLLAGDGMPLQFRGAMKAVIDWLSSLPEHVLNANPSLLVAYALTLTMMGKPVDNIESILNSAEDQLKRLPGSDQNRDTIGQIAVIRAMLAIPQNQFEMILEQGQKAKSYLHKNNLPLLTTVSWILGYGNQLFGKRIEAETAYKQAFKTSQSSGNIVISIATAIGLGQIYELNLDYGQAIEQYKQALRLSGEPPLPYACEALVGLARIAYDQGDFDSAEQYADKSLKLAQQLPNVSTPISINLLMAKIHMSKKEFKKAGKALSEAEQFAIDNQHQNQMPEITALKILFLLQQGSTELASILVHHDNNPISQAQVMFQHGDVAGALAEIKSHREKMEHNQWQSEMLDDLIFESLCQFELDLQEGSRETLNRALGLAQPADILMRFINKGELMMKMLSTQPVQPGVVVYRKKLLTAFESLSTLANQPPIPSMIGLVDPLSEREVEILNLIAQGYSNQEIANRLYLALNTVKGYNRNLFGKLNVKNRTEAIARARELHIL